MCLGLGFRVVVQDTGIGLYSMCIIYIYRYVYVYKYVRKSEIYAVQGLGV